MLVKFNLNTTRISFELEIKKSNLFSNIYFLKAVDLIERIPQIKIKITNRTEDKLENYLNLICVSNVSVF